MRADRAGARCRQLPPPARTGTALPHPAPARSVAEALLLRLGAEGRTAAHKVAWVRKQADAGWRITDALPPPATLATELTKSLGVSVGEHMVSRIAQELVAARDPRADRPPLALRQGVMTIDDLTVGE